MRAPVLLLIAALGSVLACGPSQKVVTPPPPPPRDLGPEPIGPVPEELRRVETDAYVAQVEAPNTATVNQSIQAKLVIKAKPGLTVSPAQEWKIEVVAPRDMDVTSPVVAPTTAPPSRDSITYLMTVVPLRSGVRHVSIKLAGQVCDESFCDVVGDLMSWNLEVK